MTRKTVRSPYRIDRQHIIAMLAERAVAAGAEIRFNSAVGSAGPQGAVTLANGERHTADLVVAADGINSGIRDQLGLLARRIWGPTAAHASTFRGVPRKSPPTIVTARS